MSRQAKVENYLECKKEKLVHIGGEVRGCINCIWFEQHYRRNRGNIYGFIPLVDGQCILTDEKHYVLDKPCKRYEV